MNIPKQEWDDWFSKTHGTGELEYADVIADTTGMEPDCDECVEDVFDDYEVDEL